MREIFKWSRAFVALAAAFAIGVSAGGVHADIFVGTASGGDGVSWEDPLNWNISGTDTTTRAPASGQTQTINGTFTVERSVNSTAGRTFVSNGGVLNVTGGTHSDSQSGASIYNFVGNSSTGTVNQSGGSYNIGHALRVGAGNASSNGLYNLSGGDLIISRGGNSQADGSNPGGRPSLQIGSQAAGGSGLFEVSGGSLTTRFGAHIASTGVVSVVGSSASSISIGNNTNGNGVWLQRAGSTLAASIDAGGLTPIFVDDLNDDGAGIFAEFEAGSLLDLSFEGIAPVAGTWTVLELENGDIEWDSSTGSGAGGVGGATGYNLGLALSPATLADPNWSFAVDNSGANGLLTATYAIAVPEPSSLALLGLGGLALVGRRRK